MDYIRTKSLLPLTVIQTYSTLPFIRFSHMLVGFVYFLRRHAVVYDDTISFDLNLE